MKTRTKILIWVAIAVVVFGAFAWMLYMEKKTEKKLLEQAGITDESRFYLRVSTNLGHEIGTILVTSDSIEAVVQHGDMEPKTEYVLPDKVTGKELFQWLQKEYAERYNEELKQSQNSGSGKSKDGEITVIPGTAMFYFDYDSKEEYHVICVESKLDLKDFQTNE